MDTPSLSFKPVGKYLLVEITETSRENRGKWSLDTIENYDPPYLSTGKILTSYGDLLQGDEIFFTRYHVHEDIKNHVHENIKNHVLVSLDDVVARKLREGETVTTSTSAPTPTPPPMGKAWPGLAES